MTCASRQGWECAGRSRLVSASSMLIESMPTEDNARPNQVRRGVTAEVRRTDRVRGGAGADPQPVCRSTAAP